MSKEPSMEEILSSIKRIIAEDSGQQNGPAIRPGTRRAGPDARIDGRPRATRAEAILDAIESGELDAHDRDDVGYDEADDTGDGEVLELTEAFDIPPAQPLESVQSVQSVQPAPPIPEVVRAASPAPQAVRPPQPTPQPRAPRTESAAASGPAFSAVESDAMLSVATELAARKALSSLTNMVVKPAGDAPDLTLETLVRDLLRPILKEWLDSNLPDMVQTMVAREIARIAGRTE